MPGNQTSIMCFLTPTAYYWNYKSNIVESYSLLEPYDCPVSDGNVETVYGETVQMKQDHIIPLFPC
jgi:hypothetical protein